MDLYHVLLFTAFVVLLQSRVHQAASCKNRKTVIQVRIPAKTNVTVKYPSKSDPVKFVPYPYNHHKTGPECYSCHGSRCRKCSATDNQGPFPTSSQTKTPQRTNIIIDLRREKSKQQNEQKNIDNGNKTSPSIGNDESSAGQPQEDGTIIIVQDSSLASSKSYSAASDVSNNGGEAETSSTSSVSLVTNKVIAAFEHNNTDDKSAGTTQDIYIEDESQSIAGSSAESKAESKPQPVPKTKPTPTSEPSPTQVPIPPSVPTPTPVPPVTEPPTPVPPVSEPPTPEPPAPEPPTSDSEAKSTGKYKTSPGDEKAISETLDKAEAYVGDGNKSANGVDSATAVSKSSAVVF